MHNIIFKFIFQVLQADFHMKVTQQTGTAIAGLLADESCRVLVVDAETSPVVEEKGQEKDIF